MFSLAALSLRGPSQRLNAEAACITCFRGTQNRLYATKPRQSLKMLHATIQGTRQEQHKFCFGSASLLSFYFVFCVFTAAMASWNTSVS